ncbi:unnamed protein product [Protopolystoma xenopodis]|uniref:Uncharacterized protein n=1 Tax=Protopolystoma xenopodis TaxID=117903 RepID=A0A448WT75_9PLAT|nr:unnamed protein product [Protopolystoma xenopodis]
MLLLLVVVLVLLVTLGVLVVLVAFALLALLRAGRGDEVAATVWKLSLVCVDWTTGLLRKYCNRGPNWLESAPETGGYTGGYECPARGVEKEIEVCQRY